MKKLSIIGCGRAGRTLGRLWLESGAFSMGDILNRSLASGSDAAAFIGAGRPVPDFGQLVPADLFLIAAADGAIATCAEMLALSGLVSRETVVFHLSGALPSSTLQPVADLGGRVASLHPVKSFADPQECCISFAGTWCGLEGDPEAVAVLTQALQLIGARSFAVDTAFKNMYHCGSVLVCNYLVALIEAGLRAYEKGGLPREIAVQVMEPLVRGTLENVFHAGPVAALTGPVARGDHELVLRQFEALESWDSNLAEVYRSLGRIACELSREKGGAASESLDLLTEAFRSEPDR